jgi:hypothetical protein
VGEIYIHRQILNVLNNADDDIQYFYTSRLRGEPAAWADDFHITQWSRALDEAPRSAYVGCNLVFC